FFMAAITSAELYQDPLSPKIKRIEATVAFSHPVNAGEFGRHVSLELHEAHESTQYSFTITYDKFKGQAFIHSDTVLIPADDAQMKIVVSPGVRAARGGP